MLEEIRNAIIISVHLDTAFISSGCNAEEQDGTGLQTKRRSSQLYWPVCVSEYISAQLFSI